MPTNRSSARLRAFGSTLACILGVSVPLSAQTPAPPAADSTPNPDETVVLSPFVVDADEDAGSYQATSTLAGTRVRTDLKDVASSLSVVTSKFLKDTGVTNSQSLLVYTPNTEVGGLRGNFAGVGSTFINGATESGNFLNPNANTRVRGLDSADTTRDYFQTDIPWDVFNVGRIDLQRGPNSILFGVGSPAGIINASVNAAAFKNAYEVENRVGSFGSVRNSADFNQVLIRNQLALRVAALDDDTQYRERPAFNRDKRLFAAVRWDPEFLHIKKAHTTFRANFENGNVTANRPRVLPPNDYITPFFDPNGLNKTAWDPWYTFVNGVVPQSSNPTAAGEKKNFWMTQGQGPGIGITANPQILYNNANAEVLSAAEVLGGGSGTFSFFGIGPDGSRTGNITGIPYAASIGIAGFSDHAVQNNMVNPDDPSTSAAANGVYKTKSISDPSIFDFYHNLIDGPNKREWQDWNAFNLSLEQTFFDNRLGFQVVYDHQKYREGQEANLGDPYISVDIMANATPGMPWSYNDPSVITYNGTGTPGTNPNAGRAFIGGSGTNGGRSNVSVRENFRATATGEIKATDFMSKSLLSDVLGHHVLTGLYSKETYTNESRTWSLYAVDTTWSDAIGTGPNGTGASSLINDRGVNWVAYLSDPLWSASSAAGLHLPRLTSVQSPSGQVEIRWFDSHWNRPTNPSDPNYVDPGAPWTNPALVGGPGPDTQSGNPANYVGWTAKTFNILNADKGDIDSLYTGASKLQKTTDSRAFTWQGYLWDETLVATFGWRRDHVQQRAGAAAKNPLNSSVDLDYPLGPVDPVTGTSTGESRTWGLVLHEPKAWRNALPWGTNLSLTYSNGQNTRVETRYGFDGSPLPNATGRTEDYGVVLSTLNDRLQLKATWYKTTVQNANIASVTTPVSTLGSNTSWLYSLEAWLTGSALMDQAGMQGKLPGFEWYWNWAEVDHGQTGAYADPTSAAFLNDPDTAKEKAAVASWLSQMQPQSFFNAYGYDINVQQAAAGDWAHAINHGGWQPSAYIPAIQAPGGGRINGAFPTGTVTNRSKGIELELTGRLAKNWDVSLNVTKQNAAEIALGQNLVTFIEAQHAKFLTPAGDLRLWWGGDPTALSYYNANIWGAYQFQLQTAGKLVPEMSPWRYNAVTNYAFDTGPLKGFNLGLAYRWEQGVILGYGLNAARDNLDINKPYWGSAQSAFDFWVGYHRRLGKKLDWRIQLNVYNTGQNPRLVPISVEPDGTPATQRIAEGQIWELTNTFSF